MTSGPCSEDFSLTQVEIHIQNPVQSAIKPMTGQYGYLYLRKGVLTRQSGPFISTSTSTTD